MVVPCPGQSFSAWAAALVGFHDLGKASPGFQRLLGRVAVPAFVLPAASPDRHDAMTVPILTAQLQKLGLARGTARALADAVGAHHGSIVASTEVMAAGQLVHQLQPSLGRGPRRAVSGRSCWHRCRRPAPGAGPLPAALADGPHHRGGLDWFQ